MKVFVVAVILLFVGCSQGFVYEDELDVPNRTWNSTQAVRFQTEIQDTTSFYNIYIKLSNTEFYPNSNLWLFTKTIAPNGRAQLDTVELVLATDEGKWLGEESDELWTAYYPFKMRVAFPQSGKYTFELVQGMRRLQLEDVKSVGIAIERMENN